MLVNSVREICGHLGVPDLESLKRAIYKHTKCGAWFREVNGGIQVGSIVEGVDWETEPHTLNFPFEYQELWETLDRVEKEAEHIWNMTHGCDSCGPEDPETGYRPINPDCQNCCGRGAII